MGNVNTICQGYCFQDHEIVIKSTNDENTIEPFAKRSSSATDKKQQQKYIQNQESPSKISNDNFTRYTTFKSVLKSTPSKIETINLRDVIIITAEDDAQENNINQPTQNMSSNIQVPFSVVRLTASKELSETIQLFGNELMEKFYNSKGKKWHLHPRGFYVNQIANDVTAFLTKDNYYEGALVEINNQFAPEGPGILLTRAGMFKGSFKEGKPEGSGTYSNVKNRTTFKGQWKNGQLITGIIDNSYFTFSGNFIDGQADGKGIIYFKQNKARYRGQFKNGKYQGQGVFQCNAYIYEGEFQQGKKHGSGCLTQNQIKTKQTKAKYKPSDMFTGQWFQDSFKGKQLRTA